MKQQVSLRVNGESYELFLEPDRTLLDVLRNDLGLTGTKEGCGEEHAAAGTVLLKYRGRQRLFDSRRRGKREGRSLTIEGLADAGQLHPLQRSFVDQRAIQCGFCTPGMILSAKALLDKDPNPGEEEIRRALAGNLCRCTGYAKIVKAVMECREPASPNRRLVFLARP